MKIVTELCQSAFGRRLGSRNIFVISFPITCILFQISYIKRTFAQNLEAHFHAKNKKHSDHRSR